jgi:hypothetical protein
MSCISQANQSETSRSTGTFVLELRIAARDALYITSVAAVLALTVNALRADRLALIASKDFDILVPCPEPLGSAVAIAAADPRVADAKSLLIDARASDEYKAWHLPSAISIPFDWLAEQEQITKEARLVAQSVARSAKHAVVVYGDDSDPDPGKQWAALLNTAGIRNVTYVAGGSVALRGLSASKGQP